MRLVLFDIDGTLLVSDERANKRFVVAIEQVFGTRVDMSKYQSSGKTDMAMFLDLCEIGGIPRNECRAQMKRLYDAAIAYANDQIPMEPPIVQTGVRALLNILSRRDDCLLGLVTGNLRDCARLRLGSLYQFFEVGGVR